MSEQRAAGTGRLVVAITGASGAPYALRFLQEAVKHYKEIFLMLSTQAYQVIGVETGRGVSPGSDDLCRLLGFEAPSLKLLSPKDYFSPPASGSFVHDGMVIVPCSMGTAARIAHGISDDLITRAADVCLKERRKLILVARDTPLNLIHLRNMVAVTEAGAVVLPAVPAFYHQPKTVEDLVDTVVARVLQNLGISQDIQPQWAVE